jgi:predicted DNA-binding transcriptional regulator AlpA
MLDVTNNNQPTTTNEQPTPLNPQGYSRIKPTAELIGLHHQTLRRWWKVGKFPKPVDVNGVPMFRNTDLLAFLERQHSASEV